MQAEAAGRAARPSLRPFEVSSRTRPRLPVGTDSRILGYCEGSFLTQFEGRWGLYHCFDCHRAQHVTFRGAPLGSMAGLERERAVLEVR